MADDGGLMPALGGPLTMLPLRDGALGGFEDMVLQRFVPHFPVSYSTPARERMRALLVILSAIDVVSPCVRQCEVICVRDAPRRARL